MHQEYLKDARHLNLSIMLLYWLLTRKGRAGKSRIHGVKIGANRDMPGLQMATRATSVRWVSTHSLAFNKSFSTISSKIPKKLAID